MIEIHMEGLSVFTLIFLSSAMGLVWFTEDTDYYRYRIRFRELRMKRAGLIGGVLACFMTYFPLGILRVVAVWIAAIPLIAAFGYYTGALNYTGALVTPFFPKWLIRLFLAGMVVAWPLIILAVMTSMRIIQFGVLDIVCGLLLAIGLAIPPLRMLRDNLKFQQRYAVSILIFTTTIALAAHLLSVN